MSEPDKNPASYGDISIRKLQASELNDYIKIRLSALLNAPEAFGSVYANEIDKPRTKHAERLESAIVFGAFEDQEIVGMIGFMQEDGPKDSHKGFIWGFYVKPESRGHGVGAELIQAVLKAARAIVEQTLLSVVEGNDAAVSLYKRFGFSVYGVEPRALKSGSEYRDEVLMVLIF